MPGDLREKILNGDSEYQRLLQEHSQYAAQLEQITKSPYLSSEDLIQEITLKKMKLRAKDAIEQRVAHLSHRVLV
ncbi:MAG: YdcH family protein [Candidatus Acidiferrales bacterium]